MHELRMVKSLFKRITARDSSKMTAHSAKFWDRVAPKYSKQAIADPESYEKKLKASQALMHKDMAIIEFGCGTGSTALIHARHVAHVTATDISDEMIRIATGKAEQQGISNIGFQTSSVESFTEAPIKYDMVFALNLLHLLPNQKAAIDTFSKILKPGGYLVTSTVCLSDKKWLFKPLITVMQWFGKAPYLSFISPEAVENEIISAGFASYEKWTHGRANSFFFIAKKN